MLIKPRNIELPPFHILRMCADANPDGFGFVSTNDEYKSMDFYDFYRRLKRVKKEDKCMIHFRWATHGSVCVRNCHPFKEGDFYFAHNGVLPIETANDMTDSETAFRRVILPSIKANGFASDQMIKDTDNVRSSSRFALYDKKNDKMFTLGDFYERDGVYYSNLNFLYRYRY